MALSTRPSIPPTPGGLSHTGDVREEGGQTPLLRPGSRPPRATAGGVLPGARDRTGVSAPDHQQMVLTAA